MRNPSLPSRRAILLVACLVSMSGASAQQRFDGVTLRVGTFGGSWKDAVHEQVGKTLEALGAKVEYVIGNPSENLAKVIAARGQSPIDVMEIGPAERAAMLEHGFLADIPVQSIPNKVKLPAKIQEKKLVPHIMVQNGIVYRIDKFAAAGIPVPARYNDLVHPGLAGRIAFPDVTNTQHWTAVAAMAHGAGGSEASPQPGIDKVLEAKPLYFFSAASELAQKFGQGDVIAAPWHAGWAVRLSRAGQDVGFVHPVVGDRKGAIEYNYLGIPRGAKNPQAAAAFINAFLDTQAQAEFARATGVVPTNVEARARLASDPVLRKFMLLSDREIEGAFVVDWGRIDQAKWRAQWTRSVNR